MLPTQPVNSVSSALDQMRASAEQSALKKAQVLERAQRWAIPRSLRGEIIKVALGLCGIKTDADGHVTRTDEDPPAKPREKLSAMRVLATYDKLSIDAKKLELREKATSREPDRPALDLHELSPELCTEILMLLNNGPPPLPPLPAPPPEIQAEQEMAASVRNARWPLSVEVRGAVIGTAANLCGLAITDEETVEPIPVTEENPVPEQRITLGALRVLARFDRLSLEHRRLVLLTKLLKRKQPPERNPPNYDPEVAEKIEALVAEEWLRQQEKRE